MEEINVPKINRAELEGSFREPIKITPAMVRQYNDRQIGIYDPCIICGGKYLTCGHDADTPELISRIKKLGKEGRARILRGK